MFNKPEIRRRRSTRISLHCIAACAGLTLVYLSAAAATDKAQSEAEGKTPAIEATLEQIAWIAGAWAGQGLGGSVEEHWTKPAGGSMLGMFRLVNEDSKMTVCESLMIEQEGKYVVYRFRHFGPGHKPWEAPEKPLEFDLVEVGRNIAVFDSSVQTNPKRMTYRRDGEKLAIRVQGEKDGKLDEGFTLSMQRAELGF